MIDGDFDMGNGIRLFKVPGHSLGGMAIQVQTAEGKYVITGDMPHIAQSLFPQMDKMAAKLWISHLHLRTGDPLSSTALSMTTMPAMTASTRL